MRFERFRRIQSASLLGLLALLFAFASVTSANAQGIITGSISGSVVDQTNAVIGQATITAVNDATHVTLQGKSGSDGLFLIPNVPVGRYTIAIEAPGFGKNQVQNITVVTGNASSVGRLALSAGAASESIQVEAGAAELLNTDTAQGETVIDSHQIEGFPVNGGFDSTVLVVPGIVATHDDNFSNTNGMGFSANGQRGRSNNFEIDGQSNNDNSIAGPQVFFSNQDAIQEIQVVSNNFSAQYGRNMGAIVNYITKSGTNAFHGTGFEFYNGSWLASMTQGEKAPQFNICTPGEDPVSTGCTPAVVPRYVQNSFGGTIGGPVLHDKLFFFGSTYWNRSIQGAAPSTSGGSVYPTPAGLQTLQSAFPNNPAVAALAKSSPFAITAGNPVAFGPKSLINVTDGSGTTAAVEASPISRTLPNHTYDQEHLGRLDYQITPKDRVYLRYLYQDNPTVPGSGTVSSGAYVNVVGTTHSIGGDWTHSFTPNIVSQLRYSFQQAKVVFDGGGTPGCTVSNFSDCPSRVTLGGIFGTQGLSSSFPQGRIVKVHQVQDNASWTHGKHSFLFGGEFDYQNSPNVYLPNALGSFTFTPNAPQRNLPDSTYNNGLTGALEQIGSVSLTEGAVTNHFTEPDFSIYFQDDWKLTPTFTLNLGLRYEYFSQSINELHDMSVAQQTGSNPFWDTTLPLSATTYPKTDTFNKNIEPRVGFAWSTDSKTVVRGGFAINADPAFYNLFINIASGAPLVNAGSFSCDGNCLPSGGLTYSTVQSYDQKFIPSGGDPRQRLIRNVPKNFRNPMSETYTLGIERQVLRSGVAEVRYVGNHTMHQFQSLNTNPDILTVQSAFPNYGSGVSTCTDPTAFGYGRTNCNYGYVQTTGNTSFSNYNALQTSLTMRNLHNWTGTVSYTFSRAIDNVSEFRSTGAGGTTVAYSQDPLNTNSAERGVSGNSYPNVVGLQLTYVAPWFREQHGLVGRVLGGYSFNTFYTYNSGQPFNPYQTISPITPGLDPNDVRANSSFCDQGFNLNVLAGLDSCRLIRANRRAPLGTVGINTGHGYVDYATGAPIARSDVHWLYNNQYEAIALGTPFPGAPRNTLRGDTFNNVDLTVEKSIALTERVSMQLRASAFNALNRGYYGTPDPLVDDYGEAPSGFLNNFYSQGGGASPSAGGAFGQGPGNRSVQIGGKIIF